MDFLGKIITKTPTQPTGGYSGVANGMWTMQQVARFKAASTWPIVAPVQELWAWGWNGYGQLGLGNTTNYSSPKQVGALSTWIKVTFTGTYSWMATLALKTDGTLWSWGKGSYGQLGLGNTTNYSSPKQIGALTSWAKVFGSYKGFSAIKTNGTLWTWGQNNTGQLGLGDITNRSSPTQVGALTTWLELGGGSAKHQVAVKTDGTLWSWGYNANGQLGLGNITNYSSPKQVGALTGWAKVGEVKSFVDAAAAIKTDGTLWTWGQNNYGQLGSGTTVNRSSPVQVGALTNWSKFAATSFSAFAVKTDGTLWSWGYGGAGVLGLGNTTSYSSPKQIGALTSWAGCYGMASNSGGSARKTDGTIWAWGRGGKGGLGQGNTTSHSSPVQIGALTTWVVLSAGAYANIGIKTPPTVAPANTVAPVVSGSAVDIILYYRYLDGGV